MACVLAPTAPNCPSENPTRRKLLYRSKQRGWLEMDIMLGNWAAANLPRLQEAELQQFQEVIDRVPWYR